MLKALPARDLYKACVLKSFPFTTTRRLSPLQEIVGQNRAQEAVRFALAMPHGGYNVYAVGRNGLGKRTMMLRYLEHHTDDGGRSDEWCYVANFDDPREPRVLRLRAGDGQALKQDMDRLMGRLSQVIPQTFEGDSFMERSERLKEEYAKKQQVELDRVGREAEQHGVRLSISTPGGYRLEAMNGEEPHSQKSFDGLAEKERARFESVISDLELKLRSALRSVADLEQAHADQQQALNEETLEGIAGHQFDELTERYRAYPEVREYLEGVRKDLSDSLDIFLEDNDEQAAIAYAALDRKLPRRYQINLLVNRKDHEVPVEVEENPTYHNLFGYVENVTFKGSVFTDFSLIRPGSLHRANGGYLLMDAIKVLEQPYVWDGLKRALRSRSLAINSLERELTLSGTISLEPQPIPLDVKIVLFGDRETWLLLEEHDPEFGELFRVTADFENEMDRNDDSQRQYARFIASLVSEKGLLHCHRRAVARIIEYSARMAEHQDRLSLHAADIANLLRESDFWAREGGASLIEASHINKALASAQYRSSRIRDQFFNSVRDGSTFVTVGGEEVGQVNGLSVLSTGGYEFGMSNRITATCYYGDGDVIDIERDAKLGGNIHSKGVMILTSWLSARFSANDPMHLSASLTFEQNYGEVDGDSASLGELCALVSALSGLPLRQDIAVTGSINQFGEVQPVGGLNEKVEGFFETCRIKGLSGSQGVMLPSSNVQNLMLNEEVLEAVRARRFAVYPVSSVEDAMAMLMGKPAGKPGRNGNYPANTIFGAVQKRLVAMRERSEKAAQ